MNLSQRELEDLLSEPNAASRLRLEDWSNGLWPHIRADRLTLAMRSLQNRRLQHHAIRGTLICIISFLLLLLYANPVHPPSTFVVCFFAYVLAGLIGEAVWKNVRLIAGERRAREWLVKMGDIRALPGLLRGIERGKPRYADATALLNSATTEELPAAMTPQERRDLCEVVRLYLSHFSGRLNARTSEAEADLLIAMLRFLAAREWQESQTTLRWIAGHISQHTNAAFVYEAAQSLLHNETLYPSLPENQSPANVLRLGIR